MDYLVRGKCSRKGNLRAALMSLALVGMPCVAQDLIRDEVRRKSDNVADAQKRIMEGDVAYGATRYEEALAKYSQAISLLPIAPVVHDLRNATGERFAAAAVARSIELQRKGDVAGALVLCKQALSAEIAPNNPEALAMLAQLQDPIHTNPALSVEHVKDVDQVRQLLYKADGAFQLGKFDQAKEFYENVLKTDEHNTAARRGLEKIAAAKSEHYRSGSDQMRAEMLKELDANWERPVPKLTIPSMQDVTATSEIAGQSVSEKMSSLVIPNLTIEDLSLDEAIDYLRAQSRILDILTVDPKAKGLNLVINLGNDPKGPGAAIAGRRITLKLQNIPFSVALQMICDQVGAKYITGDYLITIRPASADVREFVTRSYVVGPDFLSNENVQSAKASEDVFASEDAQRESLLPKRITAEQKLKDMGIPFPEGAFANYNPASSTVTVRNTTDAQDMVQNLVDIAAQLEPIQVNISVKVIKVQNTELQELSTDWLLNDLSLGPNVVLGGGTQGNGSAVDDIVNGAINPAPVTSGLRSGSAAAVPSSIDELIRNGTSGFSGSPQRAPGFLSVLGNNLNGAQVAMFLRGFNQKKGVDMMTNPSTMARSGQSSKIEMIREFPYATEYEPPQLPQNIGSSTLIDGTTGQVENVNPTTPVTPAHPTAFENRNVGITLEVAPVVSADRKYVDLSINQEFINFDGYVNYGSPINGGGATGTNFFDVPAGVIFTVNRTFGELTPNRILMPIFSHTRTNTAVTIADGATIVLGGMLEERVQKVEDKLPILGSIPFLGKSFQSNVLQPVKTAVVIMVTVDIQDPAGGLYRQR